MIGAIGSKALDDVIVFEVSDKRMLTLIISKEAIKLILLKIMF